MSHLIISAAYANPDGTAAIVMTADSGAVCLSAHDTPNEWRDLIAGVLSGSVSIALYQFPSEVFEPLTPWQMRQVLNLSGLRPEVEAMLASGTIELRDAWECATLFQRNNDVLVQMAPVVGLTVSQVDDLFRWGRTLQPLVA